jgi:hypothetical protein
MLREGMGLGVRWRAAAAGGLLTLALPACGLTPAQKAATCTFGQATVELAGLAQQEFIDSRDDVIRMNAARLRLKDPAFRGQELDVPFTLERVEPRVAAMQALARFGQLLTTLSTSSEEGELRAAADAFVASASSASGVTLSEQARTGITSAMEFAGSFFVEKARKEAVVEVVTSMEPTLLQIMDLLDTSFDPEGDDWTLGYDVTVAALEGLGDPDAKAEAQLGKQRASEAGAHILAALARMRDATRNLRYVLQSDGVTSDEILAFVAEVEQARSIVDILRSAQD